MISGAGNDYIKRPLDIYKFAMATKAVVLQVLHIKKIVNYAYYLDLEAIFM
jgi:hypothetical protein